MVMVRLNLVLQNTWVLETRPIKKAMAKEKFIADAKQEDDGEKKLDVMKGKNTVKVNPSLDESIKAELAALKAKKDQEIAEASAAGRSFS